MSNLLVLYYSRYGQVETMSNAVAEGARSIDGMKVATKNGPELLSGEAARQAGAKPDQPAPIASPGRARPIRCDYLWHADPVWKYGCAKCVIFSTKLESLDEWSADWPAAAAALYSPPEQGREREHHPDIYPDVVTNHVIRRNHKRELRG